MVGLLRNGPDSARSSGSDILSRFLEAKGNSVLSITCSIDVHCADLSLVVAALQIIIFLEVQNGAVS